MNKLVKQWKTYAKNGIEDFGFINVLRSKLIKSYEMYKSDGVAIPRIQEKTMNGVFNVEFDSDLSNCEQFSDSEICEWILLRDV